MEALPAEPARVVHTKTARLGVFVCCFSSYAPMHTPALSTCTRGGTHVRTPKSRTRTRARTHTRNRPHGLVNRRRRAHTKRRSETHRHRCPVIEEKTEIHEHSVTFSMTWLQVAPGGALTNRVMCQLQHQRASARCGFDERPFRTEMLLHWNRLRVFIVPVLGTYWTAGFLE